MSVSRWAKFIEDTNPSLATLPNRPAKGAQVNGEKKKEEGANLDIALEDTSNGVVTRFPVRKVEIEILIARISFS